MQGSAEVGVLSIRPGDSSGDGERMYFATVLTRDGRVSTLMCPESKVSSLSEAAVDLSKLRFVSVQFDAFASKNGKLVNMVK